MRLSSYMPATNWGLPCLFLADIHTSSSWLCFPFWVPAIVGVRPQRSYPPMAYVFLCCFAFSCYRMYSFVYAPRYLLLFFSFFRKNISLCSHHVLIVSLLESDICSSVYFIVCGTELSLFFLQVFDLVHSEGLGQSIWDSDVCVHSIILFVACDRDKNIWINLCTYLNQHVHIRDAKSHTDGSC
jgi:hypothetical protein